MSPGIVRWGGWAGVLAGVMFVPAGILIPFAPSQRPFNSFSDYLIEAILVVAFTLAVVAVEGLHVLHRGRYGRLGAAGSLITFLGYTAHSRGNCCYRSVGKRSSLLCPVHRRVGGAYRLDTLRSNDPTRAGSAMVVRCAAHRRLPPRRCRGHDHWRGERGDSVGDTLGVSGLRALVERSCPRPATRTREPSFAWVWDMVRAWKGEQMSIMKEQTWERHSNPGACGPGC